MKRILILACLTLLAALAVTGASATPVQDAYAYLQGPNAVQPGEAFNLGLWINSGSQDAIGQQSYLTATAGLEVTAITPDPATFETVFQNDICNSDVPCDFGLRTAPPHSLGFASATWGAGAYGAIHVATIALTAPQEAGNYVLHWQFSPPDPINRDCEIVDAASEMTQCRACYADYQVSVGDVTPTATPTVTPVPTITPTRIPTPTPKRPRPVPHP